MTFCNKYVYQLHPYFQLLVIRVLTHITQYIVVLLSPCDGLHSSGFLNTLILISIYYTNKIIDLNIDIVLLKH